MAWSKEPAMQEVIQFKLNGKPVKLNIDSDRKLMWVLRIGYPLAFSGRPSDQLAPKRA